MSAVSCGALGQESFDEIKVLVEINATDGDIGFHALLDGDAWDQVTVDDPSGITIFQEMAQGPLAEQGLTENFFESSEPVCAAELVEEEGERFVTLSEFQERFPAGTYTFVGSTRESGMLTGTGELTYNLPAAPDIAGFDGTGNVPTDDANVQWSHGDDLGVCPFEGLHPAPEAVQEAGWQVVVEPEDDESVSPLRVFSVDLTPEVTSVRVPQEFLDAYVAQGVNVFKFEIVAIEESGNQTASEGIFCVTECPEDED
jgi:hypothetical protein